MKIEHRGILITDLSANLTIETKGEDVLIHFRDGTIIWTGEQATDVRDALSVAIQSLRGEEPTLEAGGPWESLRDVPADVRTVYDREGDPINRNDSEDSGWDVDVDFFDGKYSPFTLTAN